MEIRKFAIVAVSSTALSLMPLAGGAIFGDASVIGSDIAYAKNGNSGNNGGGSGNAGGKSNGNASASKGNKGGSSASQNRSKSKSGNRGEKASGKGGGLFGKLFKNRSNKSKSGETNTSAKKTSSTSVAKTPKVNTYKKVRTVSVNVDKVPVPTTRPSIDERNFNAKLAGLNSLNRNYRAYMNSSDPRMEKMREFIDANIAYEAAKAAAEAADEKLATASTNFGALAETLVAYDDYTYAGKSLEELAMRLQDLEAIDDSGLSAQEAETLSTEIDDLTALLDSEEASELGTAIAEAEEAGNSASELELASGDDALKAALLAAANTNRVTEYGEDNYVDQEMLDWANALLGTGEASGIIDEIREASALEEMAETEVAVQ